ncbi:MAG: hypothetical protein IJX52_01925 [Oscillibacter sp.]|nr:hypothetical protein [Oscillibacter sp.]
MRKNDFFGKKVKKTVPVQVCKGLQWCKLLKSDLPRKRFYKMFVKFAVDGMAKSGYDNTG